MSKSLNTTTRTLRKLEADGWMADIVERRIPRTIITKDLYGFGDVLAFRDDALLIVQATMSGETYRRIAKIKAEPRAALWVTGANRFIEVWGWRFLKTTGQWEPKITEIVLADLDVDLTQPESPVE